MRIFKTLEFEKWANKEKLSKFTLQETVSELERGLIGANLGGCIYKKRVHLRGSGKRGGARTLLAYISGEKAFFIYGFAKNTKANITKAELRALKDYGSILLNYTDVELSSALKARVLVEVKDYE